MAIEYAVIQRELDDLEADLLLHPPVTSGNGLEAD